MKTSIFLLVSLYLIGTIYSGTVPVRPTLTLSGSGVAFQYNPLVPSFYDRNKPTEPPTTEYIMINGLNLSSYDTFTVEFWSSWAGSYGGTFSEYNSSQTAFYYGDAGVNVNFFGIQPSNGTYVDPGTPGVSFTQPYSSVRIGGDFNTDYNGAEINGEGRYCHFAVSYTRLPVGFSNFTIYCPEAVVQERTFSGELGQTFNLIGSNTIVLGKGLSSETSPYPGQIDELRIWSVVKNPSELAELRNTSLNGDEAGLLAYFRMDEGAGTTIRDINNRFVGNFGSGLESPRWTSQRSSLDNNFQLPRINRIRRTIPFNGFTNMDFINHQFNGARWYTQVVQFPQFARLCYFTGSACVDPTGNITSGSGTFGRFNVSLVANRGSCSSTEIFILNAGYGTTTITYSDPLIATVKIGGVNSTITTTSTALPTQGGRITITGTNLGLDAGLHYTEHVLLKDGAIEYNCTNAAVSSGGTQLQCDVEAGIGKRDITITVCKQTLTLTNGFSYLPPTIISVTPVNGNTIRINGTNFGPSRALTGTDDILVNGTRCFPTFIDHYLIVCSLNRTINDSSYELTISIGGQVTTYSFSYSLCNPNCLNGGICVGVNQCDCLRTSYNGSICQYPLPCIPECQNNSTCIFSTTTQNNSLICNCVGDWTGRACEISTIVDPNLDNNNDGDNGKKSNNVPVIAGAAGGAGAVIIILVIVVIVLASRRKPQRGTSTFIPLNKKDFTKVIYGEQLNQKPEEHSGDLKALEELLLNDNLELAFTISSITQITDADKIAKALVVIFQDHKKVLPLLEAFVNDEVRTTEQAGTLFRSNSMVSKMFKFYSRLIGLPYLYVTIGPEMDELIAEELGLEVDPEKMEEGTDLDEMRWTLMAQSQKILKAIMNSVEDCPSEFRQLFAHIRRSVAERFPENVNTTIGGFIFLRFFCPAVSSPEAYGIVEEPPSASARRLLILITKVLQNLSNDVEFGSKEPYMTKMNDFIQSNRVKLGQFYEKLVKPSIKPAVDIDMPRNIKNVSLSILSTHIRENLSKIENPEMRNKVKQIVED